MTRQCKICRSAECESQLVGGVWIKSGSSLFLILVQSTRAGCHAEKWEYTAGCLGLISHDSLGIFNGLKFFIMLKMACEEGCNITEREINKKMPCVS